MIRELTWAERAVWGTCPVCGALPGEPCTIIAILGEQYDYAHKPHVHTMRFEAASLSTHDR